MRVPEKILKARLSTVGYLFVDLWRDNAGHNRSVHRLVATAFLPNENADRVDVAHRDGTKTNNVVSNLRWSTELENCADTIVHGRTTRGTKNAQAKLCESDVDEIRRIASFGGSRRVIGESFGVNRQCIDSIINGKTWNWYVSP